jgi:UDP-N-acetylglucosamine 1-carboxyvinyltransferase
MESDFEEFLLLVKRVEIAETNDFTKLANLLGRDPKHDFAGADLSSVDLSSCDLSHAELSYTNMKGCNLTGANLRYSNLHGADLSSANLKGCDLAYANLTDCNLSNADLHGSNLAYANLTNCNLSDSDLSSIDLSLVDLSVSQQQSKQREGLESVDRETQVNQGFLPQYPIVEIHDEKDHGLNSSRVKKDLEVSDTYLEVAARPSLGRLTEFGDSSHEEMIINGPNTLCGEIEISGAKNSAIVLACASLLTSDALLLKNVPYLGDISTICHILGTMGAKIRYLSTDSIEISIRDLTRDGPPFHLVNSLRASFFCIGPILARCGSVTMPLPGGCQIGARPVVEHVKGLKALGATVDIEQGLVKAYIPNEKRRLKGAVIQLEVPSVGATETLMMAAVLAEGETIIKNAAKEPEVCDLAGLLRAMGAEICGEGTEKIIINGVSDLHGAEFTIMPDRIEAGTYLIAAAVTRSLLEVFPVIPSHIRSVLQALVAAGCKLTIIQDRIIIEPGSVHAVDICTKPYPGYPTDLQAAMMVLNATAIGSSTVKEQIFESRMQHVAELQRMGANIRIEGNTAFISGSAQLHGSLVRGTDLRGVAALILAGLGAEGETNVRGLEFLDRGYAFMDEKLRRVGASIIRKSLRPDLVFASMLQPSK